MEEKPDLNKSAFHLAGIIPVAGHKKDFGFQWDNVLMPIAENYTAIERSVMECAYAGCETIWIVCQQSIESQSQFIMFQSTQKIVIELTVMLGAFFTEQTLLIGSASK